MVWKEVTDFQIDKAVQNGMIPRHYMIDDATDRLEGYVEVYLREEIRDESAVQDVEAFEQFMEVAAISDGEMINYANIASDCGVAAKTVKAYYQILKDTLIRLQLRRGSDDYGHAFEHFIMQEIIAYRGYYRRREKVSYWHTYNNQEVDAVIGDAKVAIEIKSSEEVKTRHKNGLKAFKEEHPDCRLILVSLDPITRPSGDIELLYVNDFLRMLWNGEIF